MAAPAAKPDLARETSNGPPTNVEWKQGKALFRSVPALSDGVELTGRASATGGHFDVAFLSLAEDKFA